MQWWPLLLLLVLAPLLGASKWDRPPLGNTFESPMRNTARPVQPPPTSPRKASYTSIGSSRNARRQKLRPSPEDIFQQHQATPENMHERAVAVYEQHPELLPQMFAASTERYLLVLNLIRRTPCTQDRVLPQLAALFADDAPAYHQFMTVLLLQIMHNISISSAEPCRTLIDYLGVFAALVPACPQSRAFETARFLHTARLSIDSYEWQGLRVSATDEMQKLAVECLLGMWVIQQVRKHFETVFRAAAPGLSLACFHNCANYAVTHRFKELVAALPAAVTGARPRDERAAMVERCIDAALGLADPELLGLAARLAAQHADVLARPVQQRLEHVVLGWAIYRAFYRAYIDRYADIGKGIGKSTGDVIGTKDVIGMGMGMRMDTDTDTDVSSDTATATDTPSDTGYFARFLKAADPLAVAVQRATEADAGAMEAALQGQFYAIKQRAVPAEFAEMGRFAGQLLAGIDQRGGRQKITHQPGKIVFGRRQAKPGPQRHQQVKAQHRRWQYQRQCHQRSHWRPRHASAPREPPRQRRPADQQQHRHLHRLHPTRVKPVLRHRPHLPWMHFDRSHQTRPVRSRLHRCYLLRG